MAVQVQHRRGTAAANTTFIGAAGELVWLTDEKRWVGHDGATAGGIKVARLDEVTAEVQRAVGNADFSFQITDRLVVPNAAFTAPRTGTLPAASAVAAGRTISFFDALPALNGANVLTVVKAGSDTINGANSYVCSQPRGRWDFVSDGVSKWSVAVERAPLASPELTGTPTAPTAIAGTNTAQLATTAFVKEESDLLKSKQAWVKIYDQTVSGSPVNGFVVPLLGFTRFRITGVILPNPSAADFFVFWRGSTDGVSFDSGASDYAYTALYNENAVITSTSTNAASYGQMTGLVATAASGTALLVQGLFTNGIGGGNARMDCDSGGRSSSFKWLMRLGSERLVTTAYTHITIASSQVGAMAVGSKIIVEAC